MSIRRSTSNTASSTSSNSTPARRLARCATRTARACDCSGPWCAWAITSSTVSSMPARAISDILPLDNDELAIRHQVWLATDQAYKRASEAFSNKKAQLKQLNIDQPVDDFAKAEPVVSIGPTGEAGCGSGQVDENAGVRDFRVQERSADSILHGQPELHRALPVFREHGRHGHAARIRALPDCS